MTVSIDDEVYCLQPLTLSAVLQQRCTAASRATNRPSAARDAPIFANNTAFLGQRK